MAPQVGAAVSIFPPNIMGSRVGDPRCTKGEQTAPVVLVGSTVHHRQLSLPLLLDLCISLSHLISLFPLSVLSPACVCHTTTICCTYHMYCASVRSISMHVLGTPSNGSPCPRIRDSERPA